VAEHGKISARQLILLIFISRITITLTYLPGLNSPPANQDLWLSDLVALIIQLIFAIPVYLLYKRFPNQSIIQYSQALFGKAGKLLGLLLVWFFIHVGLLTLSQFNTYINSVIMPETPKLFFTISLTLTCAYAVSKGIKVLGRLSEIIAVLLMVSIVSLVLLLLKDMDFNEFLPILEKGPFPVIGGGFTIATRTIEVLGLAMLLPKLSDTKKLKSVFIIGYSLIILFFIIMTMAPILVFGVENAKAQVFPFFTTIRIISVADFIERIDSIHFAVWVLGAFVKVSFYYYLAVLGLSQVFQLQSYKPLIIPAAALIVPLCILISPNIVELMEFTSYKIFTWYSFFFIFVIPVILIVTALIRKKGIRNS